MSDQTSDKKDEGKIFACVQCKARTDVIFGMEESPGGVCMSCRDELHSARSANGDMQIKCPQCEKPVNFVYCPYCGAEQGASQSSTRDMEPDGIAVRKAMEEFPNEYRTAGLLVTLKAAIRTYMKHAAPYGLPSATAPTIYECRTCRAKILNPVDSRSDP